MPSTIYKRSKRSRNAAALLLTVMLGLAAYKAYFSWKKTDLYARAEALQASGNELEAAETYSRAQGIGVVRYKEGETAEALASLRPVTDLNGFFAQLHAHLQSAEQQGDTALLLASYKQYQMKAQEIAGQDETAQKRFAGMVSSNSTEDTFAQALAGAKQRLVEDLETDISQKTFDSSSQIMFLIQLPVEMFKDQKSKDQELNKLLERYDQARLDARIKGSPYADVLKEAIRIRRFYDANGVEAAWLQPKLDTYAQGTLSKLLDTNDLKGFIAAALAYQSAKELGGPASKVNTYIQSAIRKQFDHAEQLASTQKYADAIALYTILTAYKDTGKEVQNTELRWLESDPLRLLRKASGSELAFTNVVSVNNKWGAKIAAAGLLDNKTLIVARLLSDQKIAAAQAAIDSGVAVKSLHWGDKLGSGKADMPVLLVEAASKSRKTRYVAYEGTQPNMRKILDIEADKMDVDRAGILIFDNPAGGEGGAGSRAGTGTGTGTNPSNNAGEAAGRKVYYEYRDGSYALAKVKTETVEIPITELTKHKNEKVRFTCTITAVEDNKAIVQLGNSYITLSGSFRFKLGSAVVTGTYTDIEELKKAPDAQYNYIVAVSELQQ